MKSKDLPMPDLKDLTVSDLVSLRNYVEYRLTNLYTEYNDDPSEELNSEIVEWENRARSLSAEIEGKISQIFE